VTTRLNSKSCRVSGRGRRNRSDKPFSDYINPLFSLNAQKVRVGAFDVETDHFENPDNPKFVLGVTFDGERFRVFDRSDRMQIYLLSRKSPPIWVSHNLFFDLWFTFRERIFELTETFNSKPRYVIVRTHQNRTKRFIDLANFYPFSLEKIGKYIGLPKLKCEDVGYNPKDKTRLIEYCKRDAEIAYYAYKRILENTGESWVVSLPHLAFKVWRRKFLRHPVKRYSDENLRAGYFGGRCEYFYLGEVKNVYYYDFNSLYPSVCWENEFPTEIERDLTQDVDKIVCAKIRVKTDIDFYPLIPIRYGKDRKLLFVNGYIETWLYQPELTKLHELGYDYEVLDAYIGYDRYPIFRDFVDHFYNERLKAKANGDRFADLKNKLIMNSLYGKFAQRKIVKKHIGYINEIIIDDGFTFETGEQIGDVVVYFNQVYEIEQIDSRYAPYISALITSYARVKLYDAITRYKAYYCDTDSIFTHYRIKSSRELGELKFEGYGDLHIYGAKFYRFNGDRKMKGKIGDIKIETENYVETEGEVLLPLLEAIRRKKLPFTKTKIVKRFRKYDASKRWFYEINDFTYPYFLENGNLKRVFS